MIKSSTVHIANLPEDVKREDVEQIFANIGPIKKCFLLKANGYGYVTYAVPDDADRAVAQLSGHLLADRPLSVALSNRRHKRQQLAAPSSSRATPTTTTPTATTNESPAVGDKSAAPSEPVEQPANTAAAATTASRPVARKTGREAVGTASKKRARLIVRNVPFKITDEQFAAHFAALGPLVDSSLLRRADDRLVGCGFVQYRHMKHASRAIETLSGRPMLGRAVIIDWAVDKNSYDELATKSGAPADSSSNDQRSSAGLAAEGDQCVVGGGGGVTSVLEPGICDADELVGKSASDSESVGEESEDGDDEDAAADDDDGSEDEVMDTDDGEQSCDSYSVSTDGADSTRPGTAAAAAGGGDDDDGATLFVKNVSFDTDSAALRQFFAQFGALKYAVICVDSLTERPRGTAFVRFVRQEDADALLEKADSCDAADQLTLDERQLQLLPALNRLQLKNKQLGIDDEKRRAKDKRNLYLAREGLVREHTKAADGVSRTDINKRVGLEKWKAKMLKNIQMFVSKTRLCIHNIPVDWEDVQLRQLFTKHSPAGAKITEARIMRDRLDLSVHPRGASKEYGFVTFSEHEHALAALRAVNNNPNLFTASRRPIVEFSIENRSVLEARERRFQKSVANNRTSAKKPGAAAAGTAKRMTAAAARGRHQLPGHAGLEADPNIKTLPRPRKSAPRQAIRRKDVKTPRQARLRQQKEWSRAGGRGGGMADDRGPVSQKMVKSTRTVKIQKRQKTSFKEDASFTALVENYKSKLKSAQSAKTSVRWFD